MKLAGKEIEKYEDVHELLDMLNVWLMSNVDASALQGSGAFMHELGRIIGEHLDAQNPKWIRLCPKCGRPPVVETFPMSWRNGSLVVSVRCKGHVMTRFEMLDVEDNSDELRTRAVAMATRAWNREISTHEYSHVGTSYVNFAAKKEGEL